MTTRPTAILRYWWAFHSIIRGATEAGTSIPNTTDYVEKVGLRSRRGDFEGLTRTKWGYSVVPFFLPSLSSLAVAELTSRIATFQVVHNAGYGSRCARNLTSLLRFCAVAAK